MAGHETRVDHRSLKDQGIEREPQIHVGPASRNAAANGHNFYSQDRPRGRRIIPYSILDAGTRADYNAGIVACNNSEREREDRKEEADRDPLAVAQRQARRSMYADQQRDREALKAAQQKERSGHATWAKALYAAAREQAFNEVKQQMAPRWQKVRAIKDRELRADSEASRAIAMGSTAAMPNSASSIRLSHSSNANWPARTRPAK